MRKYLAFAHVQIRQSVAGVVSWVWSLRCGCSWCATPRLESEVESACEQVKDWGSTKECVCARARGRETFVLRGGKRGAHTPREREREWEQAGECACRSASEHKSKGEGERERARMQESTRGSQANTWTHLATAKLYAHSAVFTLFTRDFANLAIVMRCFRQPCIACGIGETQHARCMRASNCCEDSCRRLKRVNDQRDDTEIMLQVRVYAYSYIHFTYNAHGSPCNPARFCDVHLSSLDGSVFDASFFTNDGVFFPSHMRVVLKIITSIPNVMLVHQSVHLSKGNIHD